MRCDDVPCATAGCNGSAFVEVPEGGPLLCSFCAADAALRARAGGEELRMLVRTRSPKMPRVTLVVAGES